MSVSLWLPSFLRKALFDNDEDADAVGGALSQIGYLVDRSARRTTRVRYAVAASGSVDATSWSQVLPAQSGPIFILAARTYAGIVVGNRSSAAGSQIGSGAVGSETVIATLDAGDGVTMIPFPIPLRVEGSTRVVVRWQPAGVSTHNPGNLPILYCREEDL